MHVHPKATGHEAHGAHLLGGTRKKPPNREEVGAVKDHFSEGRQQDQKRPPRKSIQTAEPDGAQFTALDREQQFHSHSVVAKHAVHSIQSLLMGPAPESTNIPEPQVEAVQPKEQSLDDLLALMCAKS